MACAAIAMLIPSLLREAVGTCVPCVLINSIANFKLLYKVSYRKYRNDPVCLSS